MENPVHYYHLFDNMGDPLGSLKFDQVLYVFESESSTTFVKDDRTFVKEGNSVVEVSVQPVFVSISDQLLGLPEDEPSVMMELATGQVIEVVKREPSVTDWKNVISEYEKLKN